MYMMHSPAFQTALKGTGYFLASGEPAHGLRVAGQDTSPDIRSLLATSRTGLRADAVFVDQKRPVSIFKDAGTKAPSDQEVREWHETAWNVGVAPLLWVITPTEIRLYDCYKSPSSADPQQSTPTQALESYTLDQVRPQSRLDKACGRLATESGAFWAGPVGRRIDRRHRVDRELLAEINALEKRLIEVSQSVNGQQPPGDAVDFAQRLIGRCIFTWYLLDRGLAQPFLPHDLGHDLRTMFETPESAFSLFGWLGDTFNGDLFPIDDLDSERSQLTADHLEFIRDFIDGHSLAAGKEGQGRLFRFRFDAIPINLISSIYEQFARSSAAAEAKSQSLHYTPLEIVDFVLDPVLEGLPASASVIDPACGSGTFLVEAFRRLVWREAKGRPPSRALVRRVLYEQLFGIDLNPAALRITAFSMYLAAMELAEDPVRDVGELQFDELIGQTLFESDAIKTPLPSRLADKKFDVVVGNPPWPFVGKETSTGYSTTDTLGPRRSPDQAFLRLAQRISNSSGRIGMIMKATPFFSADQTAINARNEILEQLKPCAMVNLSLLRREELFPNVTGPGLVFFARCKLAPSPEQLLAGSIPWSPDFRRSGTFQVGPGEIRLVALKRVLSMPSIVKAAVFGTARDEWLLERLQRRFPTLQQALDDPRIQPRISSGAGFIVGRTNRTQCPAEYSGLPVLTRFTPFRLPIQQGTFTHTTLHRSPRIAIFRGPLLICPETIRTTPRALRGRYCVAVNRNDLLYNSSFFGVSFASEYEDLLHVLSAVLNSSLTTFQFVLGGSNVGLERTTIKPQTIRSLRVPSLAGLAAHQVAAVVAAEKCNGASLGDPDHLKALDEAVFDLYDLDSEERVLASEAVERTRHLSCQRKTDYERLLRPPTHDELRDYGSEVVQTINAYLEARGERHVRAVIYRDGLEGFPTGTSLDSSIAMRFASVPGRPSPEPDIREGDQRGLQALAESIRGQLTSRPPPYLSESRHLRIYGTDDVTVMKPAQWRHWNRTSGLNDADKILADHWHSDGCEHASPYPIGGSQTT